MKIQNKTFWQDRLFINRQSDYFLSNWWAVAMQHDNQLYVSVWLANWLLKSLSREGDSDEGGCDENNICCEIIITSESHQENK